ncbi:hypothetical protein AALC17_06130 [Oscillospiraceae bacterium 38-13]
MKRIWSSLLAAVLLVVLTVSAQADLLWAPADNAFYEKHRNELELVDRKFTANGEKGFVTLWDAPGGSGVEAQFENGEVLRVYYVYQDWGLILAGDNWDNICGWTPLADVSLIYDRISFEEEYKDQIRDYQDEFASYSGNLSRVCIYEYPGAPAAKLEIDSQMVRMELWQERLTGTAQEMSAISRIFEDEEGRTWGYIDFLDYDYLAGWFCIDEPGGTEFPVRQVPEVEYTPPQPPVTPAAAYVPYILVGGVVAVTAGLLYWFYARKREEKAR